jgi:arsenite methyltransferase
MIWSSRISKVQAARHLLNQLDLQGQETILDLGCGRGLLLLEAAQRLPTGKAIGIDLWSNEDQGNNSRQATLNNAQVLGVADRVEVHDGDMRSLSFLPDGSIDAVIASKAIHNISDRAGRHLAIKEATRVLKAVGQIAIMDIFLLDEFAESLRACGIQEVRVATLRYPAYPLLRIVTGKKKV